MAARPSRAAWRSTLLFAERQRHQPARRQQHLRQHRHGSRRHDQRRQWRRLCSMASSIRNSCRLAVYDALDSAPCGEARSTSLRRQPGPARSADQRRPGHLRWSVLRVRRYVQHGAGGTVTFELEPAAWGVQPIGTYPQIFANTANIDGNLVASSRPRMGCSRTAISGTMSSTRQHPQRHVRQLLDRRRRTTSRHCSTSDCVYDALTIVDLGLERIAFNALAGLTDNQLAVADGPRECLRRLPDRSVR